jgi:hypothetical protein
MLQLLQLAGAVLVLAGFGLNQVGVLSSRSSSYLVLNVLGAGVLAVLALDARQWGFLLLEGVWAIMALVGLMTGGRGRQGEQAIAGEAVSSDSGNLDVVGIEPP